MDVERIQKVNNLALDLMKQGLAQTREEAIEQAEKVFSNQDTEEYTQMKQTLQKVYTNPADQPKKEEEGLSNDKIKEILEKNTTFIVNQIKSFQEKIASLEREMNTLRTTVTNQRLSSVREVAAPGAQQKPVPPTESEEKSHPRVGKYKDDDVSIEKFFYMGSK